MKQRLFVLVTVLLALSMILAGCTANSPAPSPSPSPGGVTATEVKGVTIPAFSIAVNGVTVTQDEMADYPVYSVQAKSVNSAGTESTVTYVGFAVKDVLAAAKLTETYVWMEAAASDGYSATFTGAVLYENTTLLAISKDGAQFASAPWFAPCTNTTTGNYIKDTVSILVNTTEGKPDVSNPPQNGGTAGNKPEILDRTDKVEFAAFSFKVNGTAVTNDTLKGEKIYKITATTVNANGASTPADYTGYKLADVLAACDVAEGTTVKVIANDGYETELTAAQVASDYTLIAIEKDKALGEDGTVWVAPCEETESKKFMKLVVEITAQ